MFQSTHSLRSATVFFRRLPLRRSSFNPRTPCGVRLAYPSGEVDTTLVSIHALLAECDHKPLDAPRNHVVSIHALLAECDSPTPPAKQKQPWFQSTHSLRSATVFFRRLPLRRCSFNPRTPCGVRHHQRGTTPPRTTFQSTHSLRSATC